MTYTETDERGLYGGSWKNLIVDEAFSHPAKYARDLIRWIYDHLREEGWLAPGDTVVDPFGGVALGAMDAGRYGLQWIGIELEDRFVKLAECNFALWARKDWCTCGDNGQAYLSAMRQRVRETSRGSQVQPETGNDASVLQPRLLASKPQPDTARCEQSELEGRSLDSPRRVCRDSGQGTTEARARCCNGETPRSAIGARRDSAPSQREHPGQSSRELGAPDDLRAHGHSSCERHQAEKAAEDLCHMRQGVHERCSACMSLQRCVSRRETQRVLAASRRETEGTYCVTCGKFITPFPLILRGDSRRLLEVLAEAAVSSPPYGPDGLGHDAGCTRLDEEEDDRRDHEGKSRRPGYGESSGQLAQLPEGELQAAVSSPPYSDSLEHRGGIDPDLSEHAAGPRSQMRRCDTRYGQTPGQLAQLPEGELQAAVSSPPYSDSLRGGEGPGARWDFTTHSPENAIKQTCDPDYGAGPGQLAQLPEGDLQAAISSPPFGAAETRDRSPYSPGFVADMMGRAYTQGRQGETEGNLAQLDADDEGLQAAISSPPYAGIRQDGGRIAQEGVGGFGAYTDEPADFWHTQRDQRNLGNLREPKGDLDAVISSPPFEDNVGSDDPDKRGGLFRDPRRRGDANLTGTYGDSPGQLGRMAGGFEDVVSSPPFERSVGQAEGGGCLNPANAERYDTEAVGIGRWKRAQDGYGEAEGQLGAEEGETFWSAARAIVEQVFAALAPGGHAVWVTKAFVRDGERVDFPDQWRRLCEAVGFVTLHKHRTWMIQEHGVQLDLFGGEEAITKQHKSFFRLLAERKGSPRVDYEVVWCMRKPTG